MVTLTLTNVKTSGNMAAVIRIKRRLEENPLESVILSCKRRKVNNAGNEIPEDLSTVLNLTATAQQEDNIDHILRKHQQSDRAKLKQEFKNRPINISDAVRSSVRDASRNNRYKIVNCFRKTLNSEDNETAASSQSEVTVVDVETDVNENTIVANSDSSGNNEEHSNQYVYDYYYTSSDDVLHVDDYVSIEPVNKLLVYSEDNDYYTSEDSEDSNAENFFTNDYPDEEDTQSINEDDMAEAINKLDIDENQLSSDSEEADLIYGEDLDDFQDEEEELKYGRPCEKYSSNNKMRTNESFGTDTNDDSYD